MHVFFSVGEPSGDQHAAHLIEELRRRQPEIRVSGFGGPLMEQAGCDLLYPLTRLAVMGLLPVIPLLWRFYRLVRQAGRFFRGDRPDAVILVDFPGFNWWVARQAKAAGIAVFYYLPPQLWAWAPWRVRRMRRLVDHVLCALPFEKEWYRERGLAVDYVGHPVFDELASRPLDQDFCRTWPPERGPIVALLPGSRNREVSGNWPIMLEVVRRLHARHPAARFLVANYKDPHRQWCREQLRPDDHLLPLHFFVGKTSEIIALAQCSLMVSGSVSLELLARSTPAVVLYRLGKGLNLLAKFLVTCKYTSLPNLIADREIMPEFFCVGNPKADVRKMTDMLDAWLSDPGQLAQATRTMALWRDRVAQTGAIARTADAILSRLLPAAERAT